MHFKNTLENDFLTIYHGNLLFSLLKLKDKTSFSILLQKFMPTGVESLKRGTALHLRCLGFYFLTRLKNYYGNKRDVIVVWGVNMLSSY